MRGNVLQPSRKGPGDPTAQAELTAHRGQFVRVAGEPAGFAIEQATDPERIDHLWISVRAGRFGLLRITVNTSSLRNRDLGFDPRIYFGIVESNWSQLPLPGLFTSEPFDYAAVSASETVRFHQYERTALENLIQEKVGDALFVEGWGEFYVRGHPGIHQVHSRRASHAFTTDHLGRDGGLRLYFKDGYAEMLLFKFYGQP
jgi:hypothetical protein